MSTQKLSSGLGCYDAAAVESVRELYRNTIKPTRADLLDALKDHTVAVVTDASGQPVGIDIDLSSMYTTAKDLIQQLGKKTLKIGDATTTLQDLTHDPESAGFWLWLAIEVAKVLDQGMDTTTEPAGAIFTWVYEPNKSRRWYRHRVAGPVGAWIWRQNSNKGSTDSEGFKHALGNNSLTTGEVYEQVIARPSVMETDLIDIMKNAKAGKDNPDDARVLGLKLNQAATAWDPDISDPEKFKFSSKIGA